MAERTKIAVKTPEAKKNNHVFPTRKPGFSQSTGSPYDHILFLQRTIGNQAVGRLFKSGMLQAKLKIGLSNDVYEQEADRVAEQVMRMNEDSFGGGSGEAFVKPSLLIQNKIQRQAEEPEPEEQEKTLQTLPHEFDLRLDWFEMLRPFYTRGAGSMLHLDDKMRLSVGNVWTHNYRFFFNFGLGDKLSADAANFFTPFAIDSALKRDFPTASELFERNADITSFVVSPTLFNFDIHDIPGTLRFPFLKIFGVKQTNPYAPVQRKCTKCAGKEELLQIKGSPAAATPFIVTPSMESQINNLRGGGQPLPESVRAYFEPRFGYDFSQVQVHTGGEAGEMSRELNAEAFTLGSSIVFGAGQYVPETESGKRLLAHELTHVVQQVAGEAKSDSIQCENGEPSDEPAVPQGTPERAPYRLEFNNPLVNPAGHASLYELGPAVLGFVLEKLAERYPGINRNFWYRLAEWSLLGVVPIVPYMVFSHELGHYSIGEQFGWSPVPELTGFASGVTRPGVPPGTTVTPQQNIAFAAGGVNQEEINARVMYTRWALRGNVRYQEAMAYLLAQTNLALYTARTLSLSAPPSRDDINNYVTRTRSLSTGQLLAVAALADILSGPSWAALLGQYWFLRSGKRRVEMPTFTLGSQRLTYPHFQMQLLSGGPVLGGRMFLNPAGRLPVEFTFDTLLTEPGIALGATFHAIPVLTPNLRINPFTRITIADPVGIAAGVDVNYQIAPWIGISGRFGIHKNDLLSEPALPAGLFEMGGALTLSF